METLATIGQAVAIMSASWAIISGVGAWKREFIGKRKIKLAEDVLTTFFRIKDEIRFIRNPFVTLNEGTTRKHNENEKPEESELLNRGYIVVERYNQKKEVFNKFNTLKYSFMAVFGSKTEKIFKDVDDIMHDISYAANALATFYWPRQGRVSMSEDEFKKHLEEKDKYERIFWEMPQKDEISTKLQDIQNQLVVATKTCFEEPMKSYNFLTTSPTTWFKRNKV